MFNLIFQIPPEAYPKGDNRETSFPLEYEILFLIIAIITLIAWNYWNDN